MARTILITGATSGIGLALAHRLGDERLVLVGRRSIDELDDAVLSTNGFSTDNYCQCDLAEPSAGETIAAWCESQGIDAIDVLINNAGVGWTGPFWEQPVASIRELVAVNLAAPISVTQRLLPLLRRAGGEVVFVSSVVSTVAFPDMGVYVATKKALDGFVRSLRAEEPDGDVSFRVVHPGATNTAMPGKVGVPATTYERWPSASSVADGIVESLDSRSRNRAIGLPNKALRAAGVVAPGTVSLFARRRGPSTPPLAEPNHPPRALVTGAADGIGRALTLKYAAEGYEVVGIDHDQARAADVVDIAPGGRVSMRHVDLATSDVAWVRDEDPFDVVVHNAGISAVGAFESVDAKEHERVIAVNFLAPLLLTRELMASAKVTAGGRIVLMSSLSHFTGYPGAAVYAATKDGLEMYGRTLQSSLHPAVRVTTVFPGPTRTAHARRYSPDNSNERRRMAPEDLAELIFDSNRARLVPGPSGKVSAVVGRVAPRGGEALMRRLVFAKMDE